MIDTAVLSIRGLEIEFRSEGRVSAPGVDQDPSHRVGERHVQISVTIEVAGGPHVEVLIESEQIGVELGITQYGSVH